MAPFQEPAFFTEPARAVEHPVVVDDFGDDDLLGALRAQRLGIVLQPQYLLPGMQLKGFEALVRLDMRDDRWAFPDRFLPLAHSEGLMAALTLHVVEAACRTLRDWRGSHRSGMFIAVNIEAVDLCDILFGPRVCRLLAQYAIAPGEIEMELVERQSLGLGDIAKANLSLLRGAGVRLAMDDFGTGHSALSQLAELPFDVIKIDKFFLRRIPEDAVACTLMTSVIDMCLALRKEVVVEGVETEAQLRWLARPRWHRVRVQGNGLSHPLSEAEAGARVAKVPVPTSPRR